MFANTWEAIDTHHSGYPELAGANLFLEQPANIFFKTYFSCIHGEKFDGRLRLSSSCYLPFGQITYPAQPTVSPFTFHFS